MAARPPSPTWEGTSAVLVLALTVLASLWALRQFMPQPGEEWGASVDEEAPAGPPHKDPVLLGERVAYRRYFAVYDRRYRLPDGHVAAFDVVGHPSLEDFRFIVVCPVSVGSHGQGAGEPARAADEPLFTFVREFAAGSGAWHFALPTGGVEQGETPESAATRELAEEAGLAAARLVPLLPEGHPGILEVKWSRNRFYPFLALGARPAEGSLPERPREEKGMHVLSVDEEGALGLLRSGDLFLPSSVTLQLALDWLRSHPGAAAQCTNGSCPRRPSAAGAAPGPEAVSAPGVGADGLRGPGGAAGAGGAEL